MARRGEAAREHREERSGEINQTQSGGGEEVRGDEKALTDFHTGIAEIQTLNM